jgi:hypothetical protein
MLPAGSLQNERDIGALVWALVLVLPTSVGDSKCTFALDKNGIWTTQPNGYRKQMMNQVGMILT